MNDYKRDLSTDKEGRPVAKGTAGAVVGGVAGGVAGGAAAGAAAGGMTGPVGAVVGAAIGAVVGAVAGRNVHVDPAVEDAYWRDNHATRPYVTPGTSYDEYAPAYRYGSDAFSKYPGRSFEDVEPELSRDWTGARGKSSLEWEHAKHATRDAWNRTGDAIERALPGDADGDGR